MPRLAEGLAEAPPNLGGWLAVIGGSWIEHGAEIGPFGDALVERLIMVTAAALAFGNAWQEATGGKPPDMEDDRPSQQAVDTVGPKLQDGAVSAMMSWFALPQFAMSACTVLSRSPRVRSGLTDRDFHVFAAGQAAEHLPQMGFVRDLLRVLDGERLLVLDRRTRQGWTVTIGGIGDNFQLHTLLAGCPRRTPRRPARQAPGAGDHLLLPGRRDAARQADRQQPVEPGRRQRRMDLQRGRAYRHPRRQRHPRRRPRPAVLRADVPGGAAVPDDARDAHRRRHAPRRGPRRLVVAHHRPEVIGSDPHGRAAERGRRTPALRT